MRLAIVTAHAGADSLKAAVHSWLQYPPLPDEAFDVSMNSVSEIMTKPPVFIINGKHGMMDCYEVGFRRYKEDILSFFHDDLIIHDKNWLERVLLEFENPSVGLVGFGGATRHGSPSLYKEPYDYHQLGRSNFLSNMDDAENHGKRFTGSCDVAVLDGFALIVRREVLQLAGGWPLNTPINYINYDYWLSCITRRLGYRIRLVGVACNHLGGRTYVKLGIGDKPDHWTKYLTAHEYIYSEFKDVLPFEVGQ